MTMRWDPRVRRGKLLAKATLSPAGVVTGAALAGVGLAAGIAWPFVVGAGVAAWVTSALLHLRDPKLLGSLLEPEFDQDLGVLDREHLQYMTSALAARDRFEEAARSMPGDDFAGMRARVTEALNQLYHSVVWAQRAHDFLESVDENAARRRILSLPKGSRVAEELAEQLEETEAVRRQRHEMISRVVATTTGIETMAVKMGSFALGTAALGTDTTIGDEVRQLRADLDSYVDGLTEIEESIPRTLPPHTA